MDMRQLLLGCLLFLTTVLADTDPLVIKGTKFFHSSNGTQFYAKGILYDEFTGAKAGLSEVDFLSIRSACERDIPIFQQLSLNAVGLYTVDAYADHDYCIGLLRDAGIYVVVFLNAVNAASTDVDDPSWNTDEFAEKIAIVDALAGYDNVMAFMVYEDLSAADAGYSKAKVRDIKAYIAAREYRAIPVGYGMWLNPSSEENLFFTCGSEDESADFFALQTNNWCGTTLEENQWDLYLDHFNNYSAPVIMAEYGCTGNEAGVTPGLEVGLLYGDDMAEVFSGGLLYTYAGGSYGLVNVSNQEVDKGTQFSRYSSQFAHASPTSINSDSYTPTNTASSDCPTDFAASSNLPPAPDDQFCECTLQNSLCAPDTDISDDDLDALFTSICDESADLCTLHTSNATLGIYGMYSMCNGTVEAAALLSNFTQQERGDAQNYCTQVWTSAVTTNADYQPTGTCTTMPISDRYEPTGEAGTGSSESGGAGDSSSGSGLGAGAIAGIVVGAVAGIAIIAMGIFFIRRKTKATASAGVGAGSELVEPVELPPGKHYDKSELPAGPIEPVELEGERPELDSSGGSDREPVELPGEGRRET
ncbi:Glucanosyltransferase-domain-containing protein [Aspergillus pseudoustus]|uniref:1,3-beta-glucanosyltransferase n=1 Tax=Aspergillus pseudoustus TaxID=1810923 RepID=A0ABR4JDG4_9EURO